MGCPDFVCTNYKLDTDRSVADSTQTIQQLHDSAVQSVSQSSQLASDSRYVRRSDQVVDRFEVSR
jgi:hypothetical protein